jgi:O-antigen/teichoic acid export membrane protein
MTLPERLHRRRCIGLRVAVIFAILLAAVSWGDWAIMAAAAAGGVFALVVYLRDCRSSAQKTTPTDTHTRDL